MSAKTAVYYSSIVVGVLVTLFMLTAFGPKLIGEFQQYGVTYCIDIARSFLNWYDNPTAFFFTYFIGYGLVWKKPLLGSVIIVLGDALFFVFNLENMGTFIFTGPTFVVALLYCIRWWLERRPTYLG